MIRGISFEVPNAYYPVFRLIFKNIDTKEYFWFLADEDVPENYFKRDRYPGPAFEKAIQEEACYAISINLQAFPKEDDLTQIETYDDFLGSKCELVLLIDDNIYVDVYAKGQDVLAGIEKSAMENGFTNIAPITDENNKWKAYDARRFAKEGTKHGAD